ncbi:lipocalin-like domain-containing protein [Mycobacterium sp. Aquia_213]|uniref:lipocalin-like domain-containing protein n=1 Tax=Mycobacterium sp. Aquia_213 TaxID=2991728 RepID=UPI002271201E|nr:lipocalin-like domain-containing protein [Mycobacterium sp. Aquia_213]WAC90393.1 lipocalin-like domain-containing protein [Mycobacterium sp. Aquia_213]
MTTITTADELRTNLIGAWTLQSYESSALDGSDVSYPLGVDAQGFIMYTPDGYMSAQLMRAGRAPFERDDPHHAHDNELAVAAGGYMSYAGPFSVVEDGLIAHHVEVSLLPNWIGGIQYRTAQLRDSCLELGPPDPIVINGAPRRAKLVWRRT